MRWLKTDEACAYAGGVSRKTLYGAVASGKLKAARIGAGRNFVFADQWVDRWLDACAASKEKK